jgi:hypothetical protein
MTATTEPNTAPAPATDLPAIDLDRLNARQMLVIYDIYGEQDAMRRSRQLWELLDLVVEGGLEAIPGSQAGRYVKRLDDLIGEMLSPKD